MVPANLSKVCNVIWDAKTEWYDLGLELNLSESTLQTIKKVWKPRSAIYIIRKQINFGASLRKSPQVSARLRKAPQGSAKSPQSSARLRKVSASLRKAPRSLRKAPQVSASIRKSPEEPASLRKFFRLAK